MRCPKCGHLEDRVVDTRSVRSGEAIRRRRICDACNHRFTTYEEVVKAHLRVVKRDGRYEELDRQKLLSGVLRACEKRPISTSEVDVMVSKILNELEAEYERELPSTAIGLKVMENLEQKDEVAYIRFASVYRRFKDVNQFLSEVEGLIGRE